MTTTGDAKPTATGGWLQRNADPLAALAAEPTCAGSQADGVPCEELGPACDACSVFLEYRDRMRGREAPP